MTQLRPHNFAATGERDCEDEWCERCGPHARVGTGGERSRASGVESAPWDPPAMIRSCGELPPFPVDALPGWVAMQVAAVAEFTQTPPDLAGSISLAVLAAAAGGRAVVKVRGCWREPTNLFVVVAMPPGSRKSAVFAEMTSPLVAAEEHLVAEAVPRIIEAVVQREVAQRAAQEAKAAAARADDDQRAELEADAVAKATMAEAVTVPAQPRLIADDITPEAATTLLAEQGGRLAVLSAEGGIFSILAGKYNSGVPSFEVFLKGHSGDLLRVDRKGRPPEHIARPALTLGLAVQPDVLRSIAHMPGFRGRGLLARILFALPENNVGRRKVGTDPVPADIAAAYDSNLRALVASLAEWTDPAVLTLTREAAALHLEAERSLEPRLSLDGDLGHLADWASKLIGATARIAGVLHLATHYKNGWGLPVSSETMANAARLANYYTRHAAAAFDEMGADEVTDNARAVADWLRTRQAFTRRDLYAAHRTRFPVAADADPVLALLEDLDWIRRRPDPRPGSKGGRPPSPTFDVNPYVHNSQNAQNPNPGEVL